MGAGTLRVTTLIIIGVGVQNFCYSKCSQAVAARPSAEVDW
jgi:hypothetical protein